MRPLSFSLFLAAFTFAAHSAIAAPYCDKLGDPEALGKTYDRLAPIYSDAETGWIFGNDQLRQNYALKDSANSLLMQIVDEVHARGVELALLIAPPRPIVAEAIVGAATLPKSAEFDVAKASDSFHQMIAQINDAGAYAPDLLHLLEDDPDFAARYYFTGDTHWTHEGAAESSAALARVLTKAGLTGRDLADLPARGSLSPVQTYEEDGALAKIVTEVCGLRLAPEIVPTVDFPANTGGLGLLDDTPASTAPRIALLGTSFSNRNKRDEYRVADAIAHATGLDVDNYSVSGGGALSAIESYVLSGALDAGMHDILVWEVPYTTAFRSISGLRQLLGALRADSPRQTLVEASLSETGQTELAIPAMATNTLLIEIALPKSGAKKVRGRVLYDNGSSTKVTFYRSGRMSKTERDAPMRMSIDGSAKRRPVAIALTFDPGHAAGSTVSVHALN